MVLINDLNVIELQNVNNLNDTKEQMLDYFLHRLASLFNALGYFVFAMIAVASFLYTYKNPMGLIKNILFCVSFFGIASLYLDEFTSMHTGNLFHKIQSVKKFEFYNILVVIYGALSLVFPDEKYHMFTFYRALVKKPHINHIEIDGLLIIFSHFLLGMSVFIQQYSATIMAIAFSLYIISYGMAMIFNLVTDSRSKYGTMFYAILFGSVFLTLGYMMELYLVLIE